MNRVLVFVLRYMNKFVKGAKNLALTLSFVTVAACGNVKKADLDRVNKEVVDLKSAVKNLNDNVFKSNGNDEGGKSVERYAKQEDFENLAKKVVSNEKFVKDRFWKIFNDNVKDLSEVDFGVNPCFGIELIICKIDKTNCKVSFFDESGENVVDSGKTIKNLSGFINSFVDNGGSLKVDKGVSLPVVAAGSSAGRLKFNNVDFDFDNGESIKCLLNVIESIGVTENSFVEMGFDKLEIVSGVSGSTDGTIGKRNFKGVDVELFVEFMNIIKKGCVESNSECKGQGDSNDRIGVKFIANSGWQNGNTDFLVNFA